jgi:hypothetical protein
VREDVLSRSVSQADWAHTAVSKPFCAHADADADARASVNADANATDAVSAVARRDVRIARVCEVT